MTPNGILVISVSSLILGKIESQKNGGAPAAQGKTARHHDDGEVGPVVNQKTQPTGTPGGSRYCAFGLYRAQLSTENRKSLGI